MFNNKCPGWVFQGSAGFRGCRILWIWVGCQGCELGDRVRNLSRNGDGVCFKNEGNVFTRSLDGRISNNCLVFFCQTDRKTCFLKFLFMIITQPSTEFFQRDSLYEEIRFVSFRIRFVLILSLNSGA